MGRPGTSGKAYAAFTAALAIGVVVLVLLLYLGSRDKGEPVHVSSAPGAEIVEETDAMSPSSSNRARPAPPPSSSARGPAADSLTEDTAEQEEPEAAPPGSEPTASFIDAQLARGRSELRRAAATCLQSGHSARDEDLFVIEYKLVGRRGAAGPAELKVLLSNIGDRALEECIIERVQDVEWTANGPEIQVDVADSFTVGDLENLSP